MKKTYVVVRVDVGQGIEAWFPDFPGLTTPGDRLADTIFTAPPMPRRHVGQLRRDRAPVPEQTTPDIWAIHARHPGALVGFADVADERLSEKVAVAEDEALDEEISRDVKLKTLDL